MKYYIAGLIVAVTFHAFMIKDLMYQVNNINEILTILNTRQTETSKRIDNLRDKLIDNQRMNAYNKGS